MTVTEIKKLIGNKISQSKIYEILNHFFYREEFLKYLESEESKSTQPIDRIYAEKWRHILKIDGVERNIKR
jgi:hypothetical protein